MFNIKHVLLSVLYLLVGAQFFYSVNLDIGRNDYAPLSSLFLMTNTSLHTSPQDSQFSITSDECFEKREFFSGTYEIRVKPNMIEMKFFSSTKSLNYFVSPVKQRIEYTLPNVTCIFEEGTEASSLIAISKFGSINITTVNGNRFETLKGSDEAHDYAYYCKGIKEIIKEEVEKIMNVSKCIA